ncbi:8-amino-7-oxononanoate synthase [Glaciecola sp. MH2013]|uniref:aminotransferase class I/II-fold pyridoxal phosphate-dependent enzyme n=1 Tax=Glaciecola sp. MH2013 TaxID=2785524 RepID=UPI00189DDD46|nr:8-amino-7-oxononanoate synthase [Glaciecola sp. MH2013]MBF7073175.1 8-amino-7-oxononanoate synthase [Glaciecola sp. MH2013]
MAFEFMQSALDARHQAQLHRKRVSIDSNHQAVIEVNGAHYINFSSNDYLGLSQHPDILQSYAEGLSLYGASSSASSVVTGYSKEHRLLEDDICEHTNKEAALLFSSGFAANQAICTALFSHDVGAEQQHIIADKFMHASFVESATYTSMAKKTLSFSRFKHNDIEHLRAILHKQEAAATETADKTIMHRLIATEGVFSMDGDQGSLSSICDLLHQASDQSQQTPWLLVDDAHALGVVGEQGMGSCDVSASNGHATDVNILMATFGKAIGTQGAFVAGTQTLIDYMLNFSKHYIYSTAIPAAVARATRCSFAIMRMGREREVLASNIALFRRLAANAGIVLPDSESPIQVIIIGEPARAMALSDALKELGIWVNAIRTPTVPKHSDRLRITISALHQEKDITALVDALSICMQQGSQA